MAALWILGILLALGFEIIHGNALRLYEVFKLHISLLRVCFCLFLKYLHCLFYVFLWIFHNLRIGVNSIPSVSYTHLTLPTT